MFNNIEGIVLREVKYGESDKILTIFSRNHGKIQAIAKGVRKPKSTLISSTQVFCYSNFVLFKGKSFYHINQGEVISSFYKLREDLMKLAYGTFIIELTEAAIMEEESNEKLFELLLKTLKVLNQQKENYLKLTLGFQIKFISFIGYRPNLSFCGACNRPPTDKMKFNYSMGGILCKQCNDIGSYAVDIDKDTLSLIKELLYCPLDKLDDIKATDEILLKAEKVLFGYVSSHLDKKYFKSLDFIKSIDIS